MRQINVETENGTYIVKVPTGRAGARHFAIIAKAAPNKTQAELEEIKQNTNKPTEIVVEVSERDRERMIDAFEKWTTDVLPQILIDGPCKNAQGKISVDEIPGEDQWMIFQSMLEQIKTGDMSFRSR